MCAPRLMFWLGVAATLVALAEGAALVASEHDLLDGDLLDGDLPDGDLPTAIRVRRQQGRYGGSASRQQNGNRYEQNDQRSGPGLSRQQAEDAEDDEGLFSWSSPSASRNQQNVATRSQQQAGTRNRPWDSERQQADQGGVWPYGQGTPSGQGGQGGQGDQADPSRRTWGSSGGGGIGSGSGVDGVATTVQGVSAALANKWNTKVLAARGLASSLFNTGRVAARSGLQAGMAHPRFAVEAVENVF
ncbi:uncharacterized protein LOC117640504 [Thrips palmi]|uniref:Uncharacterized protein LOC117640504 n=1 Tax=Thrips palmi TaxID=161013 RepID=A0A6P8Y8E1_THRPL|nr:uncharacterized protein LOC117640504 [Thrips palmi]